MARIAGIQTQKSVKGVITHVTIDIRKHKDIIPLFKEMGVLEPSPEDRARARVANGTYHTKSEALDILLTHVRNHASWSK